MRPETVLRWHRNLIARRHARMSRPRKAGRPRTIRSIRRLVLRLARENSTRGYRGIHGELLVKFLIRDRDGKYPAMFDQVLADTGTEVVLSGVPDAPDELDHGTVDPSCRHELLDRTLIWDQAHLLRALREYERHHNDHRPRRVGRRTG